MLGLEFFDGSGRAEVDMLAAAEAAGAFSVRARLVDGRWRRTVLSAVAFGPAGTGDSRSPSQYPCGRAGKG
ncbi:hypothetical protein J8J27_31860, partial [Mycobacterium tuberculosis]|nr:hypothetical protein [Mycobacterium tuberculosis]